LDLLRLALKNLARRPTRSLLTVLGIAIGLTAVVGLLGISGGIQRALERQFERLGHDLVLILPAASGAAPRPLKIDLDLIRSLPDVAEAGGLLRKTLPVASPQTRGFLVVLGLSPEMLEAAERFFVRFELAQGRLPKAGEVLLTQGAARDLKLGSGDMVSISERGFRVSGVLKPTGDPRTEGAILMGLPELWALSGESDIVTLAWARAQAGGDVEALARKLEELIGVDFSVQTSKRLNEVVQTALRVLRVALTAIAAVALLVGGVGLMNTMYMAVLERTREIGILLSLGARRGQILALFLFEAGLLGLSGGIFGVGLGAGLAASVTLLISRVAEVPSFTPALSAPLVGLALLFSTALGMLAGLLPARRAARLNPVEALRYE
jgi:putative ABC transport system permease protein